MDIECYTNVIFKRLFHPQEVEVISLDTFSASKGFSDIMNKLDALASMGIIRAFSVIFDTGYT